jgi:ADP-heptose:LPS heptosyltransferase
MRKINKEDIQNILIIRRNNIGDMICAIPIFRTIRKEFPQAHITILADSTNAGIIEDASFIDKVIVYEKGQGIYRNKYVNYWRLFRQNNTRFDLAIALKIGFSSTLSLITLISGARLRMGCIPKKWHPLQLCYNLPVKGYKNWKSMHQVDALFEFIKTIGIENPIKDISLEITPESKNKVRDFFKENNIQTDSNIIVFNISNNKPENRWSIERFKETAEILSRQYKTIYIITSVPSDEDKAIRLAKEINVPAFYFKTPKVMDFAALVAESDLLICGEGGAMHIGAGINIPTISLWGSLRPVKWMPYGERQFVVKKGEHVNSISAGDILEVIKKNNLLKQ